MSAYIIALVLALGSPPGGVRARDAKAVQVAKNTSVHQMEPSLPDKPFGAWLRDLVGPQAEIRWEVNDCGEQTGNPQLDKGRDFPMCAEAQVNLGGKRKLSIGLSVGTFKTGVKAGPASFYDAAIAEPDGSIIGIRNLSQVPEAIKAGK